MKKLRILLTALSFLVLFSTSAYCMKRMSPKEIRSLKIKLNDFSRRLEGQIRANAVDQNLVQTAQDTLQVSPRRLVPKQYDRLSELVDQARGVRRVRRRPAPPRPPAPPEFRIEGLSQEDIAEIRRQVPGVNNVALKAAARAVRDRGEILGVDNMVQQLRRMGPKEARKKVAEAKKKERKAKAAARKRLREVESARKRRKDAERKLAKAKQEAEKRRKEVEAARKRREEAEKKAAEARRRKAEEDRKKAEAEKKKAEQDRKKAEAKRKKAEAERKKAEEEAEKRRKEVVEARKRRKEAEREAAEKKRKLEEWKKEMERVEEEPPTIIPPEKVVAPPAVVPPPVAPPAPAVPGEEIEETELTMVELLDQTNVPMRDRPRYIGIVNNRIQALRRANQEITKEELANEIITNRANEVADRNLYLGIMERTMGAKGYDTDEMNIF